MTAAEFAQEVRKAMLSRYDAGIVYGPALEVGAPAYYMRVVLGNEAFSIEVRKEVGDAA